MMRPRRHEDGAAAVEAALVLPFLLLLLFGIVEFASAYAHQNDVRNAAETVARIGARNDFSTPGDVVPLVCGDLDVEALGPVVVDVSKRPGDPKSVGTRGDIGRAVVSVSYQSYTGFFPLFNNIEIRQAVDFVIETTEDVDWWPESEGDFTCP